MFLANDTIVSLCSAEGGAVAMIRISGKYAFTIAARLAPHASFELRESHTLFLATVMDEKQVIDEVIFAIFEEGKSYTHEATVEIFCHGSPFIIQKIIQLAIAAGARIAKPGEFTQRAFLHGRLDLVQAEAVAELIATSSASQHRIAMHQMRGGFSTQLAKLRSDLIHFATLLELEIDFSEEDVEFAQRSVLLQMIEATLAYLKQLIHSFQQGNAIKKGIGIVIVGKPNVGKSTLFNAFLEDEKAIVSDIAGTTRDYIEDSMQIQGVLFRFIDTAGLRATEDTIEKIGVERTQQQIQKADTILLLTDTIQENPNTLQMDMLGTLQAHQRIIHVLTKADVQKDVPIPNTYIAISVKERQGLDQLKSAIVTPYLASTNETLLTNARHHSCLQAASEELTRLKDGLQESTLSSDMLSWHLRQALHHIGELTGEVCTEDILDNIFSKFCIGK